MTRPLKILAPGRELGTDSTRPMTRLVEHSRGAVLARREPPTRRRSGASFCACCSRRYKDPRIGGGCRRRLAHGRVSSVGPHGQQRVAWI